MARSWMLKQLEYATRTHHIAADAPRIALLFQPPISRTRYVDFLAHVHVFEAAVESAWGRVATLSRAIEVEPRLHAQTLRSDLAALRVPADMAPLPMIVGVEQALGWMYVVERGRRLNVMLHHHLAHRLPDELAIGGAYLRASSPNGARWEQLGTALDRTAYNRAAAHQIHNAAHRAFRVLRSIPLTFTGTRAA